MILSLVLMARDDILTNVLRALFDWIVGVIIPYYAISRSLRDIKSFRDTLMSIIVATLVVCVIGGFEFVRHWILYATLGDALGTTFTPGYLGRGDYLRASATSGQAIVLGYVVATAIGLYLGMGKMVPNRWAYRAGAALLLVGIVAPLSRGPWIGMTAMVLMFILAGKNVVKQIAKLAVVLGLLFGVLALTGNTEAIVQFLPFVGNIDDFNVSYRQQLFDRSIQVVLENPFFGSNTYLSKMEDLRQGQGIIDLVNTYIIVALNTGLAGLTLFVSFFAWILFAVAKGARAGHTDADTKELGKALFVTLAGVLIMIFSVSTVYHVPIYLWSIAALGVAYHRMCSQPAQQQSVRPPGKTQPKRNEQQRTQFLVE
jgi:O-antigen ligase